MLVKINPAIGTTSRHLQAYNFMRAITAVATAAAGTTPVCRPMTAQNTYNNSLNVITEVIANTEGGGWLTSGTDDTQAHNLPDATYTDTNFQNRVYRADFYRTTGKVDQPYMKFTIMPSIHHAWTSHPYLDMLCGLHTDIKYNAVTGYVPTQDTDVGGAGIASVNLTSPASGHYAHHPFRWDTNNANWSYDGLTVSKSEYLVAITQNYVIIINPLYMITYFGLRTTNVWEEGYGNNPAVVGWSTPSTLGGYESFSWRGGQWAQTNRKMFAWWLLKDGVNTIRPTPYLSYYRPDRFDTWADNRVTTTIVPAEWTGYINNRWDPPGYYQTISKITGDARGNPLFAMKNYQGYIPSHYWPENAGGGYGFSMSADAVQTPASAVGFGPSGRNYPPVTDPQTGMTVPCAHPINMMISTAHNDNSALVFYNEGGRCQGIYRSMSGHSDLFDLVYTPGQNFVIDGEDYYPCVLAYSRSMQDMFLIRRY